MNYACGGWTRGFDRPFARSEWGFAENVAAFNHNVAKVYADPVDDALGLRQGLW